MIKWVLSEKCKDCTLCGPRGRQDLYGLGQGVYPEGKSPRLPAHWGCNCSEILV